GERSGRAQEDHPRVREALARRGSARHLHAAVAPHHSAQREGEGLDDHAEPLPEQPARYRLVDRVTTVRVKGGQNIYGFTVGILMLDTRFPRIPGEMGNATTFDFPVRYHRVSGASPDRVVRQGQRELLPSFIEGARFLEREGVRAITTNCGF